MRILYTWILCVICSVQANERPNVLFLAVDDMKDWVNCLGGYEGTVYTPNTDRLAARGVLFTNAHCPSPKCAPSRTAILTGFRPSTTGFYDNSHWWYPNLPDIVTIPAYFRRQGYLSVGAGKIFHHTAGNHPPNQWDDFQRLLFRDDPWFRGSKLNYPWSKHGPYPEGFPLSGVDGLGHENDWGSLKLDEPDYDDSRSARYAVRFLQRAHEKPFFLACGLFRPHLPWYVPASYFDLYPLDRIAVPEAPENDLDDLPKAAKILAKSRRNDLVRIRQAGKWKHAIRAYLASISYADAQLGRVLDALDASAYANNTFVILWSDHGWHLGEKQHWHKSTLWEEATRVPFIIAGPTVTPSRCERPVNLLDLFPTLNELCGLPAIATHDGVSLGPLLRDPQEDWNRPSIIEYQLGNVAVRSDRYRYIRYHDGGEEFYDLVEDPKEWRNLTGDPDFAEAKSKLVPWATSKWAEPALNKSAFEFNPDTFTWREKATGLIVNARSLDKVEN